MPEEYTISALTPNDANALRQFYLDRPEWVRHWFDPFPGPDENKIVKHLEQASAGEAISFGLFTSEGNVLGHGFVKDTCKRPPVFGIGLSESIMGCGWGRKLMDTVITEADGIGLPKLTLTVFKDNIRAQRLYKEFAFVVTGESDCRKTGDSLAMERLLGGGANSSMRNSLLQMLDGRRTETPVWTADITYWMAGERMRGNADPNWDTEEGYLQLHRDLGIMPYFEYTKFWAGIARYDTSINETWEHKGSRSLHRLETPYGALSEEHTELTDSACIGCTEHFVQTEQDLDMLLRLLNHRRLVPANLGEYFQRLERWAVFDGIPALGLPPSPMASFCYEWAGIENMVYLLTDCEKKVREALEIMEEQEQPVIDAVCQLAPPLVHFPDNLDSNNFAGLYEEFLAPVHRQRISRLHAADIRVAVHLDGAVGGLLPHVIQAGFDAVEAVTPRPGGDLSVQEMAQVSGSENVILWGGVPGVMFAPPYKWQDMEDHVTELLEAWGERPFVLGVADQVPPDGDIRFCRKIYDMLGEK